jgi:hypothetical protein
VLVEPLSATHRYSVRPLASTRNVPGSPVLVLTVAADPDVAVGAGVEAEP